MADSEVYAGGPGLEADAAAGGDEAAASGDSLDRAVDAAFLLAADRPWREISLRDIALAAGIGFADLYVRTPGKAALLTEASARMDAAALASVQDEPSVEVHDALFEAVMARVEAMAEHRNALIAIARSEGPLALAPRLARTARTLMEAAGINTDGVRGAARVAAMTGVWARVLQVWRDDDGALNRTMAEIDKRLRQMNRRLQRVGAGF